MTPCKKCRAAVDRQMHLTYQEVEMLRAHTGRLEGVIADALAAMDKGLMGDVRRILKTGRAAAVIPHTGVVGKVDCQP